MVGVSPPFDIASGKIAEVFLNLIPLRLPSDAGSLDLSEYHMPF